MMLMPMIKYPGKMVAWIGGTLSHTVTFTGWVTWHFLQLNEQGWKRNHLQTGNRFRKGCDYQPCTSFRPGSQFIVVYMHVWPLNVVPSRTETKQTWIIESFERNLKNSTYVFDPVITKTLLLIALERILCYTAFPFVTFTSQIHQYCY